MHCSTQSATTGGAGGLRKAPRISQMLLADLYTSSMLFQSMEWTTELSPPQADGARYERIPGLAAPTVNEPAKRVTEIRRYQGAFLPSPLRGSTFKCRLTQGSASLHPGLSSAATPWLGTGMMCATSDGTADSAFRIKAPERQNLVKSYRQRRWTSFDSGHATPHSVFNLRPSILIRVNSCEFVVNFFPGVRHGA